MGLVSAEFSAKGASDEVEFVRLATR